MAEQSAETSDLRAGVELKQVISTAVNSAQEILRKTQELVNLFDNSVESLAAGELRDGLQDPVKQLKAAWIELDRDLRRKAGTRRTDAQIARAACPRVEAAIRGAQAVYDLLARAGDRGEIPTLRQYGGGILEGLKAIHVEVRKAEDAAELLEGRDPPARGPVSGPKGYPGPTSPAPTPPAERSDLQRRVGIVLRRRMQATWEEMERLIYPLRENTSEEQWAELHSQMGTVRDRQMRDIEDDMSLLFGS